ncbi:uncharacterized protein BJ171DRAFT_567290 [Polychytrium aggregatum]|uniref:uncharacterized protein n=1 Tax=Polychytrium aggregatum TaxID=110093 RepID=UPI0022FDE1FF|nr:uncharacterized protein BJ171DRAFT_567290 [Polychytrium aggregatum]KAI9205504.1 hypothetical protein BJ171DRAFT_567290 [Polychytrium aggregatum]
MAEIFDFSRGNQREVFVDRYLWRAIFLAGDADSTDHVSQSLDPMAAYIRLHNYHGKMYKKTFQTRLIRIDKNDRADRTDKTDRANTINRTAFDFMTVRVSEYLYPSICIRVFVSEYLYPKVPGRLMFIITIMAQPISKLFETAIGAFRQWYQG